MPQTVARYADYTEAGLGAEKMGPIYTFMREAVVSELLPWMNEVELLHKGWRYDRVHAAQPVALNSPFNSSWLEGRPFSNGQVLVGAHIDVPKRLMEDPKFMRQVSYNKMAMEQGTAIRFTENFFEGSVAAEPNGFDGIGVLIEHSPPEQQVYPQTLLDFSPGSSALTEDQAREFFRLLNLAVSRIRGGKPTAGFASGRMIQFMRHAAWKVQMLGNHADWWAGGVRIDSARIKGEEFYNQPTFIYGGAGTPVPFFDVGNTVEGRPILRSDYHDPVVGANGDCEHIWFCQFGEQSLYGVQLAPPGWTAEIETLEAMPVKRSRFEWSHTIAMPQPKAISLVGGVKLGDTWG